VDAPPESSSPQPAATAARIESGVAPHVTVARDFVSLDGERVDAVPSPAKARRFDTLFERLRDRRRATRGPREIWIDVPADTPPLILASAVKTAAFAGFARQHLRAGGDWLVVSVFLPGPPSEPQPDVTRLVVDVRTATAHVRWQSTRPCAEVPDDTEVPLADLAAHLNRRCAGSSECFQRVIMGLASAASSADVLAGLAAAGSGIPRRDLPVDFAMVAPPSRICGEPLPSDPAGRIAPEKIQQVVREKFGPFRICYEKGLARNQNLQGRVTVKFIIQRDGSVFRASDAGSDLPDPDVIACVVRGFGELKFPKPDGGIVTVVYPIQFNPGD
jgi:hypothetical protein